MDVHIPAAITEQLRRRNVDVLTVQEDGTRELPDEDVLHRAHQIGRVIFTHDIGFRVLAETWQSRGIEFSGLVFGGSRRASIGKFIEDLFLIAEVHEPKDARNMVWYVPL